MEIKKQSSGEVNDLLTLEYLGEPQHRLGKQFTGVKAVLDKGENFYSIASGMYRYKHGSVLNTSGYEDLYQKASPELYRSFMVGKTAVFEKLSHAYRCFPELINHPDYTFIHMTLDGPLQTVMMERHGINEIFRVVIGGRILDMQRIPIHEKRKISQE